MQQYRENEFVILEALKGHLLLIASQTGYDDIPIIETANYKGLKLDDIIQNLQQVSKPLRSLRVMQL